MFPKLKLEAQVTLLHVIFYEKQLDETQKIRFAIPIQDLLPKLYIHQVFEPHYNSSTNVLIGTPTGKPWAFREYPRSKVVYIAPLYVIIGKLDELVQ
ncbi:4181_t:CDS:2, partial [Funneliformis caledonium]